MHRADCQCPTCHVRRVVAPATASLNLTPALDLVDEV